MRKHYQFFVITALLLGLTFFSFMPVLNNLFINFDDPGYVTDNAHVRAGISWDMIVWSLTATSEGNWHPLTWISHALDCTLFGARPGPHHAVSLILHMFTAALLFVVLERMTKARWQSAFAAAVFSIHPFLVESVAWAAERKDVLSALFFVATLGAYARYARSQRMGPYAGSLALFILGLAAKPMLVTLPFVLFLLDYWPLGRIPFKRMDQVPARKEAATGRGRIFVEKIPFLILASASSIVTYVIQLQQGIVAPSYALPLGERLANTVVSYALYAWKTVLPIDLAVFYPHPVGAVYGWAAAAALAALTGVTALVWKERRDQPYLIVGWLWFLGMLVPVIGIVQVGLQAMADRYMSLPVIGLAIMIAWGIPRLIPSGAFNRPAIIAAGILAVIGMAVATRVQAAYWKDNFTLYGHALAVTSNNHLIETNLGVALADSGRHREAIPHLMEALRMVPGQISAHANLARSLVALGRRREALDQYNWILGYVPSDPQLHRRMGDVLADDGRPDEAIAHYLEAIRLDTSDISSRCKLAELYADRGEFDLAARQCLTVLRTQPSVSKAHEVLGIIAAGEKRNADAEREFSEAIRCDSANADAYNNLGILYDRLGRSDEAFRMYQRSVLADSQQWNAHFNLGVAFAKLRRMGEARDQWVTTTLLSPSFTDAYLNLARLSVLEGKPEDAIREYAVAIRIDSSNVQAHIALGELLEGAGRLEEAQAHFEDAVRLAPSLERARAALERVRAKLHRRPPGG